MRVHVLFFGILKDVVGKASDTVELKAGASTRDLLAHYEARIPRLKESLMSAAVAVNREYANSNAMLKANDEVALLPPVSGGTSGAGATGTGRAMIVREPIDTQKIVASL